MENVNRNATFSQFITEKTSVGKIEVCGVLDGSTLKVISLADAESAFNEPNDPLIAQMKAFLAFVLEAEEKHNPYRLTQAHINKFSEIVPNIWQETKLIKIKKTLENREITLEQEVEVENEAEGIQIFKLKKPEQLQLLKPLTLRALSEILGISCSSPIIHHLGSDVSDAQAQKSQPQVSAITQSPESPESITMSLQAAPDIDDEKPSCSTQPVKRKGTDLSISAKLKTLVIPLKKLKPRDLLLPTSKKAPAMEISDSGDISIGELERTALGIDHFIEVAHSVIKQWSITPEKSEKDIATKSNTNEGDCKTILQLLNAYLPSIEASVEQIIRLEERGISESKDICLNILGLTTELARKVYASHILKQQQYKEIAKELKLLPEKADIYCRIVRYVTNELKKDPPK